MICSVVKLLGMMLPMNESEPHGEPQDNEIFGGCARSRFKGSPAPRKPYSRGSFMFDVALRESQAGWGLRSSDLKRLPRTSLHRSETLLNEPQNHAPSQKQQHRNLCVER